jgi:hypothetical protein
VRNRFQTPINAFGIWKEYLYRPSYDPDAGISAKDLYHPHPSASAISVDDDREEESSGYSSKSVQLLLDWQNTGSSTKSNDEINRLVHDVLFHPDFRLGELLRFNARRENHKANVLAEESTFLQSFQHATVNIEVPSGSRDRPSQRFPIPGLYYRKLIDLIKDTFKDPISLRFHLTPFKLF